MVGVNQTYAHEALFETHGKEKQGNGTASTKPDSQGPPFDYPAHVKGS